MRLALAVVPPMSNEITLGKPSAVPICADALMFGIGIGMQEADRDRFDTGGLKHLAGFGDARFLQRLFHVARAENPLRHLARELPRHQRAVAMEEQVVGLRAIAAADDVNV